MNKELKEMTKKVLWITVQLLLVLGIGIWYQVDKKKTAYVEISAVYNAFDLQKELTSNYNHIQQARQNLLDSLKIDLEGTYRSLQTSKNEDQVKMFENKRTFFLQKQQQFESENQQIMSQYDEQVWTQLNQYIKDFGDYYSYDYIYGANGTGTMMYANEANNISESLIDFVNEKYHGKTN